MQTALGVWCFNSEKVDKVCSPPPLLFQTNMITQINLQMFALGQRKESACSRSTHLWNSLPQGGKMVRPVDGVISPSITLTLAIMAKWDFWVQRWFISENQFQESKGSGRLLPSFLVCFLAVSGQPLWTRPRQTFWFDPEGGLLFLQSTCVLNVTKSHPIYGDPMN